MMLRYCDACYLSITASYHQIINLPVSDSATATKITAAETAEISATEAAPAVTTATAAASATATETTAAGQEDPAATASTSPGSPVTVAIAASPVISAAVIIIIVVAGFSKDHSQDDESENKNEDPDAGSETVRLTPTLGAVVGVFAPAQFHDPVNSAINTLKVVAFPEGRDNGILNNVKCNGIR